MICHQELQNIVGGWGVKGGYCHVWGKSVGEGRRGGRDLGIDCCGLKCWQLYTRPPDHSMVPQGG